MNLGAAVALRNEAVKVRIDRTKHEFSAAAKGVGPAHGECHDVAMDGGFKTKSHDNFGSSYTHPDGTELRVQPNGNWSMKKSGNGAMSLSKHMVAPEEQPQQPVKKK